jgi:hypothetical protein
LNIDKYKLVLRKKLSKWKISSGIPRGFGVSVKIDFETVWAHKRIFCQIWPRVNRKGVIFIILVDRIKKELLRELSTVNIFI